MGEVAGERGPARAAQGVRRQRLAVDEPLLDGEVARLLERAEVRGEVPVRRLERVAELVEGRLAARRKDRGDPEADLLVEQRVERERCGAPGRVLARSARHRSILRTT